MGEPTECRMYLCIRAENRNENGNFSLDTIYWDTYWRNIKA